MDDPSIETQPTMRNQEDYTGVVCLLVRERADDGMLGLGLSQTGNFPVIRQPFPWPGVEVR